MELLKTMDELKRLLEASDPTLEVFVERLTRTMEYSLDSRVPDKDISQFTYIIRVNKQIHPDNTLHFKFYCPPIEYTRYVEYTALFPGNRGQRTFAIGQHVRSNIKKPTSQNFPQENLDFLGTLQESDWRLTSKQEAIVKNWYKTNS